MPDNTMHDLFTQSLLLTFEEAFENVHGMFLDKGTSMFETLATISAEEASRPVGAKCASIAAQVEHVRFVLDLTVQFATGNPPAKVDWDEIWRTVREVTPEEWEASKQRLRASYQDLIQTVKSMPGWEGPNVMRGTMAVVAHIAYHLGEIRQATCTVKNNP
jgi:hypothetical protein